jgi:hypothetical protein
MIEIDIRGSAKCLKHPRFNPATEGLAGVKGGCGACYALLQLHRLVTDFSGQLEHHAGDSRFVVKLKNKAKRK